MIVPQAADDSEADLCFLERVSPRTACHSCCNVWGNEKKTRPTPLHDEIRFQVQWCTNTRPKQLPPATSRETGTTPLQIRSCQLAHRDRQRRTPLVPRLDATSSCECCTELRSRLRLEKVTSTQRGSQKKNKKKRGAKKLLFPKKATSLRCVHTFSSGTPYCKFISCVFSLVLHARARRLSLSETDRWLRSCVSG